MNKEFYIMKKVLLFCLLSAVCTKNLWADEYAELVSYRDSPKQKIEAIDSEIIRCEKSLKNWQAVASGIGIILQNNQVQENKKTLNKISSEAKEADEAIKFIQKAN